MIKPIYKWKSRPLRVLALLVAVPLHLVIVPVWILVEEMPEELAALRREIIKSWRGQRDA